MTDDSRHRAISTDPVFAAHDPAAASVAATERRPAASGVRARGGVVSLCLASVLLVSALAFGFWLVKEAPDVSSGSVDHPGLSASGDYSAYGGDAYTGIQNAAVDTEVAVVDGANALADVAIALDTRREAAAAAQWRHLWFALSALLIALAAVNFNVSLQRYLTPRAS